MRIKNVFHPEIWIPVVLLILGSLPFVFTNLDLDLQKLLYRDGWFLGSRQPWFALYQAGTFPGLILAALALVVLIGAWIWPKLQFQRRAAALVVLTLIIGPGLLVNALGKEYWGRPRPRDVVEFNGSQKFHRITEPGVPGRGKSFPCGHASVGFLFVSLYFITRNKKLKWSLLGLGLTYGTLMGLGRMTQGAHFASDVLWSGGLVYLTAAVLHHVVLPETKPTRTLAQETPDPGKKTMAGMLLGGGLCALTAFFLLATPYYKQWSDTIAAIPNIKTITFRFPPGKEDIHIIHAEQDVLVIAKAELRGFGFPKLHLSGELHSQVQGTTCTASLSLSFDRITTERLGIIQFFIRKDLKLILQQDNVNRHIRIGKNSLPGLYGKLQLSGQKADFVFRPMRGSLIQGPIHLSSQQGDIRVVCEELYDPGPFLWDLKTDCGTILIETTQHQAPVQPMRLRAHSDTGEVAYQGIISPECGLHLQWDAGAGRSSLHAKGHWQPEDNQVIGPTGTGKPHMKISLSTVSGIIGIKIKQGKGDPVAAIPAPTAGPTRESAFEIPPPDPTPTQPPLVWIEKEFIGIPKKKPAQPRSPFEVTPEVNLKTK
ncbi:phosphatase PAP2 family protein [bacterium]|nr:phosphatase PAP2 family protein [bacterium]